MIWWRNANEDERKLLRTIFIVLRKDPGLLGFLLCDDKPRLKESIEDLLALSASCFSAQQDVMFRVAMDIWSGSGETRVWELIEFLDDERLRLVLEALGYLGTKFNGWDGPVCRQLKTDIQTDSDNLRRQLKTDIESDI